MLILCLIIDIDSRNQDNIIVRFGVTTTATVVSLIVLVLLIVGFVLIVKQRSGRRKKYLRLHEITF